MSAAVIAASATTSTVITESMVGSSGNWVCPAGVTSVTIDSVSPGGGGWKGSGTGKGAGGAGGNAVQKTNYAVTPGTSYPWTIGAAGVGAAGAVAATPGGDVTFNTTVLVNKGGKAATGINGPGVGQTTSCVGDIKNAGSSGINGATGGAGGNAASVGVLTGGAGAAQTSGTSAGGTGSTPGGGGSGGGSATTLNGGNGAPGALSLTYTQSI